MGLQGVTRDDFWHRGRLGVGQQTLHHFKKIKRNMMFSFGMQVHIYNMMFSIGMQGVTRGYQWLQGITWGYKELQGMILGIGDAWA